MGSGIACGRLVGRRLMLAAADGAHLPVEEQLQLRRIVESLAREVADLVGRAADEVERLVVPV
jgi:hypothetical protein